jgi:uncharacterized protein YjgD (DUF1641 family)
MLLQLDCLGLLDRLLGSRARQNISVRVFNFVTKPSVTQVLRVSMPRYITITD